ncbi:MAG: hypothetical protein KBA81_00750 [Rhabdochlamydiaceae bacterium]|nr:hypothetical protein [Rhabdochlamydiaceae bacterium]
MNTKKLSGLIALAVGVALIGLSFYIRYRMREASEGFEQISGFFPKSAVGGAVEHSVYGKIASYGPMAALSLVCGIILTIAGTYVVVRFRKKR